MIEQISKTRSRRCAGVPPGSSSGVFGDADQLGKLNFLTDERTAATASLVRTGAVFPLDMPLLDEHLNLAWRKQPSHAILHVGHEARGGAPGGHHDPCHGFCDRDDFLDGEWLQGSSQWDGLAHISHPENGNYNGIADSGMHGDAGTKLGVEQWGERGMVGRGRLIDVANYHADLGKSIDPKDNYGSTPEDLLTTAAAHGVEFQLGDILLIRTGWLGNFLGLTDNARETFKTQLRAPGLLAEEGTVAFLWDQQVAAVATDTMGV